MAENSSLSRFGLVLLLLAILSGTALMCPFLTAGSLTLDEHGSYWVVESETPSTVISRSLNYAAIPPLSAWLQQALIILFGRTEFVFRMSSALPFLLAIVVVFLLTSEISNSFVAGLAALLLACHPESMDEVRIARCYGLVIFLSSISFWITIRWIKSPSRWDYSLGWSLCAACLLWTHYLTAPIMALELLVLIGWLKFESPRQRPAWKPLLTALVLVTIAGLPLIPSVLRMAEWNSALGFGQQPASLWSLLGPIWIVGLGLGLIVARGLSIWSKAPISPAQSNSVLFTFLVWGVAPILFMAIVTNCGMAGLNNPRYRAAFAVPGVCCLAMLLSFKSQPWAAFLGAISLLCGAWLMLPNRPWQPTRVSGIEREEWKEIALQIERDGHPGEPVFVQSGLSEAFLVPLYFNDPIFMDYVACRAGKFYLQSEHPRYALPFLWADPSPMTLHFRQILQKNASAGQTVWIACATDTDLCRDSLPWMDRILKQAGYHSTSRTTFHTAELVRYAVENSSHIDSTGR